MEEESLNLTKYLSTAGVASRRHAAELIKEGHVLVNGVVETNPGTRITSSDAVICDGRKVIPRKAAQRHYIMLNKPSDTVSTTEDDPKSVMKLLPPAFSCMDMFEALNGKVDDPNSYKDFGYFGVLGADFDEDGRATGTYTPKLSFRALQVISSLLCEKVDLCDLPLIFRPEFCGRTWEKDLTARDLTCQGFVKPNGSMAFAYWAPTNIMTMDYEGTISFKLVTKEEVRLVDLMDGSIYQIPESMCTRDAFNTLEISHLPVKDYPMMLLIGDFE